MNIPFLSFNDINKSIKEDLKNEFDRFIDDGWYVLGNKLKTFESEFATYSGTAFCSGVGNGLDALIIALKALGVGPGDEVIVPAYTYSATANVVQHCGARVVFVDVNQRDFNICPDEIRKAITSRTKVIMPVDFAGWPCDFNQINAMVNEPSHRALFHAAHPNQEMLGRIMVLSDAAHSIGAKYCGKRTGTLADASVFSFHAVKNLTTAEGGAVCFNLPSDFEHQTIYKDFCIKILHGQSKDALAKTVKGAWKYDVIEPGYKCNMTDIQAAIGLIELERYGENLERRKSIFEAYDAAFGKQDWAILPKYKDENRETCYHLYLLRIASISETQRDAIIQEIFEQDVAVNVHFQPLPLLTAYKNLGYSIGNYPEAYLKYAAEISLPVYFNLTDEQVETVIQAVENAVKKVIG
jgi:dTDP-4-amino-4,6-dideoxygalactose transaminase